MDVFVIFPSDPSIQFLKPILDELKIIATKGVINLTTLSNDDNTHDSFAKLAYDIRISPADALYLFMGHGASNVMHGNVIEEIVLMDLNQARATFVNRNLISLSCRSSEFISTMGNLKSGIGFDVLPTDYQEIESEIDAGEYKVSDLNIEDIANKYRSILISSFSKSLTQVLSENLSLNYLKNQLKLRLNKALSRNVTSEMTDEQRLLCHLIYQTKIGIKCVGNHHTNLF